MISWSRGRLYDLAPTRRARSNGSKEETTMPTIRVIRSGEGQYTTEVSHTGHEHLAEGKSLHEAVGKLICEHPDLLELCVTMQDIGTNPRAKVVELQPSCWCE